MKFSKDNTHTSAVPTLILTGLMAFSISGCGDKNQEPAAVDDGQASSTTQSTGNDQPRNQVERAQQQLDAALEQTQQRLDQTLQEVDEETR